MAANVARSRQDFPGQYRSGGSQLVGNTINTEGGPIYLTSDNSARNDSDQQCLQALLVTDPRVEKTRISLSKDALLDGSCTWVLGDPAFVDWWNKDDIRILWIHGDPGKGKTMMAMALVEEISTRLQPPVVKGVVGKDIAEKGILAYFFCQGTIDGLNDAISVLRGLIYVLVEERQDLLYHVTKIYNNEGSNLFEGSYGLCALWKLLLDIIRDPLVPQVYLMIDALDECGAYQVELLRLLTEGDGASCPKVKWLITSRNEPQIQEMLDGNDRVCHVSLESYSQHVSKAVGAFIDFKIQKLKKYNDSLRETVGAYLHDNANGTFLWVALVCQRLEKTPVRKTLSALKEFPPGLEPLYGRMFGQIWHMEDRENVEYCRKILCAAILAYRPLHLNEFVFVAELPDAFSDYLIDMKELVALCGSFLIIRDDVVYFVHQSAKDYLNGAGGSQIFPCGPLHEHKTLAHRSAALISNTLKTDVCGLQHPGTPREEIGADRVSRCIAAHVQYACCYWIDHLLGRPLYSSTLRDSALLDQSDEKVVHQFFCQDLLHWLEAVSLMGKISDSIMAVMNLESCLVVNQDTELLSIVHDARRFILSYRFVLEETPLQVYSSALAFSPVKCVVRQNYARQLPGWVEILGSTEEEWSACLQTLEGHSGNIFTVAFSPDGQLVASGSEDRTVRLWDVQTGAARGTLEGHSSDINTVVFSPDGQLVASGSDDNTIRLWDTQTGAARGTLEGHSDSINTVAFSPDGQLIASGSDDRTVRLWDTQTGAARGTLEGHSSDINTVAFSPDGRLVASGSDDRTVRLWDTQTGAARGTLEGHSDYIFTVAFSPDGRLVASGSYDRTIRLWDTQTGAARGTLEGHSGSIFTVAFSPDGQLMASGSYDRTIRLWDTQTGVARGILEGHSDSINTVTFSPDGRLVASGSSDSTVRLWDTQTGAARGTLEGHSGPIFTVAFSPDGRLVASGSYDRMVRLWNALTSAARGTLEGHLRGISTVAFSPDGRLVASRSYDGMVKLWDVKTGKPVHIIEKGLHNDLSFIFDSSHLNVGTNGVGAEVPPFNASSSEQLRTDSSYSLDDTGQWVSLRGRKVLWIPPNRRPGVSAVRDNIIVIGNDSGRMTFLSFKTGAGLSI